MRRSYILVAGVVLSSAAGAQQATVRVTDSGSVVRIDYGPFDLPARTMHDRLEQPPTLIVHLPADGWLRGMDVELVDAVGRPIPRRLLHHMNVIAPDSRDLFSSVMLRLGAAGAETAPITLPRIIGLRAHRGDSLFVTLMFHNPTDTTYDHVTLRLRMPFTRGSSAIGAMTVYPMSVAIGPKNKPNVFDLPPGHSEHAWEGSPAVPARILGLSGHLHRYGVALRLEDRTSGDVLWEVRPETDSTGEVLEMPVTKFIWSFGKSIRPDHVYRLTAIYENPTGQVIPEGGMGVMGGIVMLTSGAAWPAVDRTNADYLADVMAILGPMAHHMMP